MIVYHLHKYTYICIIGVPNNATPPFLDGQWRKYIKMQSVSSSRQSPSKHNYIAPLLKLNGARLLSWPIL
jgi:hypothetical protein